MRRHPKVFGPFYISMVARRRAYRGAGGDLPQLFHHIEFEKEIKDQVSQALRYPMFVIVVMGVALVIRQHFPSFPLSGRISRISMPSCR